MRIWFSPRLVVPDNIPASAYQLPLSNHWTGYGQKSYWQCFLWVIWMYFPPPIENCSAYPMVAGSLCSLKLMHESYSSWQKMQGETEHESLNVASPRTLKPWISKEFGKSFTDFFVVVVVLFLLLPCLGLYNFPVFIWYGLVCRVLRPPRKGTYIKEACFLGFSQS